MNPSNYPLHYTLNLRPDQTIAIIGAGGKTTALWSLAEERRAAGDFSLVTTSTYIFSPPEGKCDALLSPLDASSLISNCTPGKLICALYADENIHHTKCTGLPSALFEAAASAGIHPLYEADGSKCLPAKMHAPHEPVIHDNTDCVLLIAGLRALGSPVSEVCHRYTRSKRMATSPDRAFDLTDLLETIYDGIRSCKQPQNNIRILLNQADTAALIDVAQEAAEHLRADGYFTAIGSLTNPNWPKRPCVP